MIEAPKRKNSIRGGHKQIQKVKKASAVFDEKHARFQQGVQFCVKVRVFQIVVLH